MILTEKRERRLFKKAVAVMLTVLFGLSPALPIFECGEVRAAANSNLAREVWQTREELADGTYNTSGSGQAGYIIFGTRPEVKYQAAGGNEATAAAGPIKWLIIGQDTEGTLELYSEEPLMSANQYDNSSNSIFEPDVGEPYKKDDSTYGEVYINHYGASNFRKNLQSIAENTSYFKSKEQNLMLSTEVTTQDTLNNKEYKTEDKLYGLHAKPWETTIYAGVNNSLPVNIKYWKAYHWLRSPYPDNDNTALVASSGYYVYNTLVDYSYPAPAAALKLNLSSVIFSSAARSAAITATAIGGENLAAYANTYNLRLEGPSITGEIRRNTDYTEITAKDVPTSGTYYLMVQGVADDGTNYAYSKEISSGTATIKASDITTTSVSSFEGAKAWVEKASADSDGQLLYASSLTTIAPETPETPVTPETPIAPETPVTPETPYAPTETPGEVDENVETIEEEENALNTVKTSDKLTNFTLFGLALVATFASLGLVLTSKMSKKKSDE